MYIVDIVTILQYIDSDSSSIPADAVTAITSPAYGQSPPITRWRKKSTGSVTSVTKPNAAATREEDIFSVCRLFPDHREAEGHQVSLDKLDRYGTGFDRERGWGDE